MTPAQQELQRLRDENARLRRELAATRLQNGEKVAVGATGSASPLQPEALHFRRPHDLNKQQVERYSRQLLLPSFGIEAQGKLCKASVLIVGCGGLGSPAALYLAAMGVGRLGLVDRDTVEASNLHRQIAHTEARAGHHKALSARAACAELNSGVAVDVHTNGFTTANAVALAQQYDVVLDCSDNPATRYLVSDACAATGRPLVSGAAVGTDGQLTVYCCGDDGPCYRCLFPESPAPENCSRCADAGVLGVVPGVVGTLQALEAVKLVTGVGAPLARRLLVFDGLAGRFMTVQLRGRRPECVACGVEASITAGSLESYDYEAFTGQAAGDGPPPPLQLLAPQERIDVRQLRERLASTSSTGAPGSSSAPSCGSDPSCGTGRRRVVLLDVRPAHQFAIMSLPGAHNVPFAQFDKHLEHVKALCLGQLPAAVEGTPGEGAAREAAARVDSASSSGSGNASSSSNGSDGGSGSGSGRSSGISTGCCGGGGSGSGSGIQCKAGGVGKHSERPEVVVMCRRGNDSQRAVVRLRQLGIGWAVDVVGGYTAWAAQVDSSMPVL